MADEVPKLTAEELKAWDQYAAAALTAIIDVNDELHDEPHTAAYARSNDTHIAAKYADHMLAARRKRTRPTP